MLFKLHEASMRPYIELIWGWNTSDQRKMFTERLELSQIEIIEEDDTAVGMVEVVQQEDHIHLNNIRIFPMHQGKRIGTYIINEIWALVKSKSLPLKLRVFKVNKKTKELHQRLGFQIIGELEHHYIMERKT